MCKLSNDGRVPYRTEHSSFPLDGRLRNLPSNLCRLLFEVPHADVAHLPCCLSNLAAHGLVDGGLSFSHCLVHGALRSLRRLLCEPDEHRAVQQCLLCSLVELVADQVRKDSPTDHGDSG